MWHSSIQIPFSLPIVEQRCLLVQDIGLADQYVQSFVELCSKKVSQYKSDSKQGASCKNCYLEIISGLMRLAPDFFVVRGQPPLVATVRLPFRLYY